MQPQKLRYLIMSYAFIHPEMKIKLIIKPDSVFLINNLLDT